MATAAEIVVLIDAAIATSLEAGALKRVSDAVGISVEKYGLDELMKLRREYSAIAAESSTTGGISLTLVTNKQPS